MVIPRWRIGKAGIGLAVVVVLMALLAIFTPPAGADNNACPGAILLLADGSIRDGFFTAAPQQRWFKFVAKANRSYAIMSENTSPLDQVSGVQAVIGIVDPIGGSCAGTVVPGVTFTESMEPQSWNLLQGGSLRDSVVVAADNFLFFAITSGVVGGTFRVRVVETTQFSPLWSTFGGFQTFYRFQNTTNQALVVTLKLINDAGATVVSTVFTIAANGTSPTRNTGPTDLALAPNQAGQAIIMHNGTPGALQVDGFLGNFIGASVVLPVKIVAARQQR